jgi:dehydrogenase/reductase SDR family member 12
MIELEERILVRRSVKDCFRYVRDFSTIEQWDPGVYRAVKVTAGEARVGSQFDLILNSGGRRVPMAYELVGMVDDEELVLEGRGDGFSAHDVIRFRAVGDGQTEIHYRARLSFSGLMGKVTPALKPWLDRVGKKAVEGLERALTIEDHVSEPSWWETSAARTAAEAYAYTERGYLAMDNKGLSEFVDGKTMVITGPTSGLGLAAACELARLGARLVLVGRDGARLARACQEIVDFSGCSPQDLNVVTADLALMADVRVASAEIARVAGPIDVLINNAGALFNERGETSEGMERTLAINLLAPYLLTRELLPHLRAPGARVINVSSGGMYTQPMRLDDMGFKKGSYDGPKAYARVKRALVAMTEHMALEHPADHVTFNSMHPGWAKTPGVEKSLPTFDRVMRPLLRDSRMGADTIVWLATTKAVEGVSGSFWFDRRPRPTVVFPGTGVSVEQRAALMDWLATTAHG